MTKYKLNKKIKQLFCCHDWKLQARVGYTKEWYKCRKCGKTREVSWE